MTFIETRRRRRSSKSLTTVSIATLLALLVTTSTLCLTLLGYGHDLAYLDAVGLRPEQLQRTPLDFLLRSWQPVVHLLTQVNKLNQLEFHRLFWTEIWWKTWWVLFSLPLLTAFVA